MVIDELKEHATFGVVSRKDIIDSKKMDRNSFDYRTRNKTLIKMHRGIYRLFGAEDSFEARAYALTKYAGPRSAISHFGAAHLHGIEGFKEPSSLDVLVPCDVEVHPKGVNVHRTREHFQIYKFEKLIPITSLARTLVDLSEHLDHKRLESALNSAYRIKDTIGPWLRSYLATLDRTDWRGRDVLLQMIERMGKRGLDSELEVEVLHMIEKEDLPTPDRQFEIRDRQGKRVMRGDLGYVEQEIVLHIDSRFHQSQEAMARDAKQRSILTDLEWTQLFVTKRTIKDRVWLEQLKRALAKAAARRTARTTH